MLNRLKSKQVFLDHKTGKDVGQTAVPKAGKTDKETQGLMTY